jgi:short-subunit dehydrogenase
VQGVSLSGIDKSFCKTVLLGNIFNFINSYNFSEEFVMKLNKKIRIFDRATAVVTGGASGIGRGLAEELAKRGCEVVLADRQIELAQEVASKICASGCKAMAVKVDVTDFTAVEQLVQETVERTGRLDYIFNNAGIGIGGNVNHFSIEDWNQMMDVNLRGVINGVQAAHKVMMAQGFGHIVNTASLAGLTPSPGNVAYAATKHAVVGLSISLRAEAAQLGVRVSVLCPGFVRTAILDGGGKYGKMLIDLSPEQHRHLLAMIEKFKPISPNVFAKKALNSVAKNKAIIIVPAWWKLLWWMNRLFPSMGIHLVEKSFQKMQKKFGFAEQN